MGFFKTDIELIEPKKQTNNKTECGAEPPLKRTTSFSYKIKVKSLNGYDAIREKLEDSNTLTVKQPIQQQKPKLKVSIGL